MPRITVKVKTELVRQNLQNLFAQVPKIGKLKIRNAVNRILVRMQGAGKKVTYPIKWDSPLQRAAYFATDGFTIKGKRPPGYVNSHIPYHRTGKYQAGWKVKEAGKAGYILLNNNRHGKYISGNAYGSGQSRIHGGRWVLFRDATELEISKLPAEITKEIVLVARRKGFA